LWFTLACGFGTTNASVRGTSVSNILGVDRSKTTPSTRMLEMADFVPLGCNMNVNSAPCTSWTDIFGTDDVKTDRITIPCGKCIEMDFTGPTLELLGGLDIHGKLVFPDEYKLSITTTLIAVQGQLDIEASKPVDGEPSIKFTLVGEDDQSFTPIKENASACNNGQDCNAGKKGIVVAGGKVNSKCSVSEM
jgi:hypothetical protein